MGVEVVLEEEVEEEEVAEEEEEVAEEEEVVEEAWEGAKRLLWSLTVTRVSSSPGGRKMRW